MGVYVNTPWICWDSISSTEKNAAVTGMISGGSRVIQRLPSVTWGRNSRCSSRNPALVRRICSSCTMTLRSEGGLPDKYHSFSCPFPGKKSSRSRQREKGEVFLTQLVRISRSFGIPSGGISPRNASVICRFSRRVKFPAVLLSINCCWRLQRRSFSVSEKFRAINSLTECRPVSEHPSSAPSAASASCRWEPRER